MVGRGLVIARDDGVHIKDAAVVARRDVVIALDHEFVADVAAVGRRRTIVGLRADIDDALVVDVAVDREGHRLAVVNRFTGFVTFCEPRNAVREDRVVTGTAANIERTAAIDRERTHAAEARGPAVFTDREIGVEGVCLTGLTEEGAALFNLDRTGAHGIVRELKNAVARLFKRDAGRHRLRHRDVTIRLFFGVVEENRGFVVFAFGRDRHGRIFAAKRIDVRRTDRDVVAERERAALEVDGVAFELEGRTVARKGNSTGVSIGQSFEVVVNFNRRTACGVQREARLLADRHVARVLVIGQIVDVKRCLVGQRQIAFADERAVHDRLAARELETADLLQAGRFSPGGEIQRTGFVDNDVLGLRQYGFIDERGIAVHRHGRGIPERTAFADGQNSFGTAVADCGRTVIGVVASCEFEFTLDKRDRAVAVRIGDVSTQHGSIVPILT